MANSHTNQNACSNWTTKCKSSKSDNKMSKQSEQYFGDMVTRIEKRHCDLIGRHKHLREKITTMERSIPALIAYNLWTADQQCQDAPYCKVREIMKQFSSYPDPTEKLLHNLKDTVEDLNRETAELHDKIINADVKLEETSMELESLELANLEMENEVKNLETEVSTFNTPSLHSIHSEDLICLTKIRQLAKQELSLKNCIKELEKKEILFKEQIDRLLTNKEFQNIAGNKKMINRIEELEYNEKRMNCALRTYKYNMHQLKKKFMQREKQLVELDTEKGQENCQKTVHMTEKNFLRKEQTVPLEKSPELPFIVANNNALARLINIQHHV